MVPIRLESPNRKGEYNVTILGVGDKGYRVVENYPCPDIHEDVSITRSLSICDDNNNDFYNFFENTDILFVVTDIVDNTSSIIKYAKLHQDNAKNKEATILINIGNGNDIYKFKDSFTAVISCDDINKVHRIVEMLTLDMHNGYVGLDITEMNWIVRSSCKLGFSEISASNENQIKESLIDVCKKIREEYPGDSKINAIVYIKTPLHHELLEYCSDILDIFADYSIYGWGRISEYGDVWLKDIVFQISTHCDKKDNSFLISIIYGTKNYEAK